MLQAGRIIEDGPPDRLMRREGPYRELAASSSASRSGRLLDPGNLNDLGEFSFWPLDR